MIGKTRFASTGRHGQKPAKLPDLCRAHGNQPDSDTENWDYEKRIAAEWVNTPSVR